MQIAAFEVAKELEIGPGTGGLGPWLGEPWVLESSEHVVFGYVFDVANVGCEVVLGFEALVVPAVDALKPLGDFRQ